MDIVIWALGAGVVFLIFITWTNSFLGLADFFLLNIWVQMPIWALFWGALLEVCLFWCIRKIKIRPGLLCSTAIYGINMVFVGHFLFNFGIPYIPSFDIDGQMLLDPQLSIRYISAMYVVFVFLACSNFIIKVMQNEKKKQYVFKIDDYTILDACGDAFSIAGDIYQARGGRPMLFDKNSFHAKNSGWLPIGDLFHGNAGSSIGAGGGSSDTDLDIGF